MAAREVVSLARMKLLRPAQGAALDSAYCRLRIYQLFKHHRVMPSGACHAEHKRHAVFAGDEVPFAATLASVPRVGARVRASRELGTDAPSMLVRLTSNWSASRSSANETPCVGNAIPQLQGLMPQGVSVRSTSRMPLSAFSSFSLGLSPLGGADACGSRGAIFFHNGELISAYFFMHCRTSVHRFVMTGFFVWL